MAVKRVLILLAAFVLLCFSALADEINIVVSFYPVHIFTMNIIKGVEGVNLQSLAAPTTGCLHDYQLLSSDMQKLSSADVFVINGAGMETYIDAVIRQMPDIKLIDASEGIGLLPAASIRKTPKDGEKAQKQSLKRGVSQVNSHIWLDPKNAIKMAENIASKLSELYPDKAHKFKENFKAYEERLLLLDKEMHEGLKPYRGAKIVTFHEAFSYFTRAFGLESLAVLALEPDAAISSSLLGEMSKMIRENGLPPLFMDNQYQSKMVKILSSETGAKSYALDPIVTGEYSEDAYEKAQRNNLEVLKKALGEEK